MTKNTYDQLEFALRERGYWTPADELGWTPGDMMNIVRKGDMSVVITRCKA